MLQKISIAALVIAIVTGLTACAMFDRIQRLQYATSLFSGKEQYENFSKVPDMFPVSTVSASATPDNLIVGDEMELLEAFEHESQKSATAAFLEETDTVALLVMQDGKVRYENYWLTGGADVQWPSWSVAKSYVSALVGIAINEGLIESVEDPITHYLPELNGSGYADISIKNILQMSSGARWNENYSDFNSDINRLGRIIALGGSLDNFVTTIGPDIPAGTYNRYNSADTQVLGRLLVKVSGRSLSEYMEEKLWKPLGAENDGYWLIDNKNMEMAFAGFHATARDYAKIGELYRNKGQHQGVQLVPAAWVSESTIATEPHLIAGPNEASNNEFGYGYQWWLLNGDEGEFTAMGVYNQFIYVNPEKGVVIVKLSANSEFGVTDDQSSYRDQETMSMFRAIAQHVIENENED